MNFDPELKIYVCLAATDMRKGFAGLSGIARGGLGADPTDGSLFIFINRRRARMKLPHFNAGGYWRYYRLLEKSAFEQLTADGDDQRRQIDAIELSMLLSGVSLQTAFGAGVPQDPRRSIPTTMPSADF